MILFNGKKEAEKILSDLKKRIKKNKIKPRLAIILVGEDKTSKLYIRNKKKAAKEIGIEILEYNFKKNSKEGKIVKKIKELNGDPSMNGIIVQLPLPKSLRTDKIVGIIKAGKDVDGFSKGRKYFQPVLPSAVFLALRETNQYLKQKKIVALVNSDLFGKTLKSFLRKKRIKINYLFGKKVLPEKLKKELKKADVVISVLGHPKLIKGEMIKEKTILVDAGINLLDNKKVVGDVNRKSVIRKAAFLTPVPGGIGPLVVALLLKNVFLAKKYGSGSK